MSKKVANYQLTQIWIDGQKLSKKYLVGYITEKETLVKIFAVLKLYPIRFTHFTFMKQ